MAYDTFRSAIFFWVPDFVRGEAFNVGIALLSKETKFSGARFIDEAEFKRMYEAFDLPLKPENLSWYMQLFRDYTHIAEEATERGRTFPLRFDHPFAFTALYGRSNETTIFQWRDASSGFVTEPSPLDMMNRLFDEFVSHPPRKRHG